jgi:opacity protein-like surface antigen
LSLTWQAVAGLNWAFAEHWSLTLAYRALGIDRSGAVEDGILHGPLLGLGLRF